jgi:hypothetical protein
MHAVLPTDDDITVRTCSATVLLVVTTISVRFDEQL